MDRLVPTLIIVGIALAALAGMLRGWRALTRRSAGFSSPDRVPAVVGEEIAAVSGLYVATTFAAKPFERVAAHGLGFRARATVSFTSGGITVELTGRDPFFIARSTLFAVETATWTIDKAVEPGGLAVVTWRLGDVDLDSYFRIDDGSEVFLRAGAAVIEGSE